MNRDARKYVTAWVNGLMIPGPTAPGPPPTEYSNGAIQFIKKVLYEAFDERRFDTQAVNLELGGVAPLSETRIAQALDGQVGTVVQMLLEDAEVEAESSDDGRKLSSYSGNRVLLADILVAVNRNWCNVWPFCRPSRRDISATADRPDLR
jgi:hypothetical protein